MQQTFLLWFGQIAQNVSQKTFALISNYSLKPNLWNSTLGLSRYFSARLRHYFFFGRVSGICHFNTICCVQVRWFFFLDHFCHYIANVKGALSIIRTWVLLLLEGTTNRNQLVAIFFLEEMWRTLKTTLVGIHFHANSLLMMVNAGFCVPATRATVNNTGQLI